MAADTPEATRVVLSSDHPWAGYSGEVTDRLDDGCWVVRLDNGTEVYAWPRQRVVLRGTRRV